MDYFNPIFSIFRSSVIIKDSITLASVFHSLTLHCKLTTKNICPFLFSMKKKMSNSINILQFNHFYTNIWV